MKIYFCASVSGGRGQAKLYPTLVDTMEEFGEVLTKHLADQTLSDQGEFEIPAGQIHERDLKWLKDADLVIADVSIPSLGVGYELGRAVTMQKPILAIYDVGQVSRLSGMISGCPVIVVKPYSTEEEAVAHINSYLLNHSK